jgi:hypothetical protein
VSTANIVTTGDEAKSFLAESNHFRVRASRDSKTLERCYKPIVVYTTTTIIIIAPASKIYTKGTTTSYDFSPSAIAPCIAIIFLTVSQGGIIKSKRVASYKLGTA